MTSVLVTGATTPIGERVVESMLVDPRVKRVLAVGAEREPRSGFLQAGPKLRYVQADITRSRTLRELLYGPVRELRIDSVIHAAQHRRATDQGPRVHALNVDATRELLHLCEQHPTIRRFVFRSYGEIYRVRAEEPVLIQEDHPLDFSPGAPQWIRDRVEADMTVCAHVGSGPLSIVVLRAAECIAPDVGSQLVDYLGSRVCFRPLGFDPILNLSSVPDLARGLVMAAFGKAQGIFNLPGRDTLPLSRAIAKAGRRGLPAPAILLHPLYRMRTRVLRSDFRYDANQARFHFSGVLDGRRAREVLGYEPLHPIDWSRVPRM